MRAELTLGLPFGRVVTVRAGGGPPVASDVVDGAPLFAGRVFVALEQGAMVVTEGEAPVDRRALEGWLLPDFHALRDVGERLGALAIEEPPELQCRNCEAPLAGDPRASDIDALTDWYEGEVESEPGPLDLPEAVRVGRRSAREVHLAPVTVARARPLWRALVQERAPEITPRLVCALGVVALGEERSPELIAAALDGASDDVWAVVETLFLALAYSPRATFPVVCPGCGAVHDVAAPELREFEPDPRGEALVHGFADPADGDFPADFPTDLEFEAMVERVGGEVYAARGVRNVALRVEPGVPAVDPSGEPLLGSYEPRQLGDDAGYTELEFLITLYLRTFRSMWDVDGPYDVEGEVRETIDHEVEHHLHHLSGYDPLDAEEQREARRELERTFGKRRVREAEAASLVAELRTMVKLGVPFALLCAALLAVARLLGWL